MNDQTIFVLEHAALAHRVYETIAELESNLLPALEGALKRELSNVLGADWSPHPESDLEGDWWWGATHTSLSLAVDEATLTPLISPMIWLDTATGADDPIWTLLDIAIAHPGRACVGVSFDGLFEHWKPMDRKLRFKERLTPLIGAGFKLRGGESDPKLELPLRIPPSAFVSGLRDGDWADALHPIREGWALALQHRAVLEGLAAEVQ